MYLFGLEKMQQETKEQVPWLKLKDSWQQKVMLTGLLLLELLKVLKHHCLNQHLPNGTMKYPRCLAQDHLAVSMNFLYSADSWCFIMGLRRSSYLQLIVR